ncbi:TPA: eae-like domain protein [Escherichia coli]
MESNIKGLVAAGHEMASELKAECGAVDMRSVAKLISYLATQLEVQLVRANALAAENALARKAVQAFCDVVGDSTEVICEEIGRDGVLVILEAMKATGNMPATDAFLAEVRAQGVEMYADNLDNGADDAERGGFDYAVKFLRSEASSVRLFADQLRKGGKQ